MSETTIAALQEEIAALRRRVEQLEGSPTAALPRRRMDDNLATLPHTRFDLMSAAELETRASEWEERVRRRIGPGPNAPLWEAMQESLRRRLGVAYWPWFAGALLVADTNEGLTVEVLNGLAARWLPLRYADVIGDVMTDLGRPGTPVTFVARE